MSSAICLNSDQSKFLSSGNGLMSKELSGPLRMDGDYAP